MERTAPGEAAELTSQGIGALKEGDTPRAYELLCRAVQLDPANERAWLWLSGAVATDALRRYCLQRVLDLNPHNQVARLGLESLPPLDPPVVITPEMCVAPGAFASVEEAAALILATLPELEPPAVVSEQHELGQAGWASEDLDGRAEAPLDRPTSPLAVVPGAALAPATQPDAAPVAATGETLRLNPELLPDAAPVVATGELLRLNPELLPEQPFEPVEAAVPLSHRRRRLLLELPLALLVLFCGVSLLFRGLSAMEEQPAVVKAVPRPTPTPVPGWQRHAAEGVELWLPETYQDGDPSEVARATTEELRALGPEYEDLARSAEEHPPSFVLWAYDTELNESGFMTNVLVGKEQARGEVLLENYIELSVRNLPDLYRVVAKELVTLDQERAGRVILETSMEGEPVTQLIYIIKRERTFWSVTYTTDTAEFPQRLRVFDQSIRTFMAQP